MNDTRLSLLDARILLVDDDPGTIQGLARVLAGYSQLRFATSGAQALHIAAEWPPELVLLDAEMPGLSGFDVFKALQADPRLAGVPVIFVTQHGEPQVEVAVFELGAADFVTKPVTGPALRARVAMHLQLARLTQALAARPALDGLTGLASRLQFETRLADEWARAQRSGQALSLLLADVDHFRTYTQTQGAVAGDDCLRAVARCVQALAQRPGDLAARHGADAFALLLPDTDAAGAAALAARLVQAVHALDLAHPGSPLARRVTASVGLGTLPARAADRGPAAGPDALQQAAQAALDSVRGADGPRTAALPLAGDLAADVLRAPHPQPREHHP